MYQGIFAILVATLIIMLSIPGCGGGDATTKSEFIKQASAVCKEGAQERTENLKAAEQYISDSPSRLAMRQRQYRIYTSVIVPSMRTELQKLDDLEAPTGEGGLFDAIIEAFKEAVASVEEGPTASHAEAFGKFNRLVKEYGLTACAIF